MKDEFKTFFQSRAFLIGMYILFGIIILVAIFAAGLSIGQHRAHYDESWRSQYLQNFGTTGNPPADHGTIGKIISAPLPLVIVEDQSGIEKMILIGSDTTIRDAGETLQALQLQPGEFIVAVGDPNAQGQIQARFIRIIPSPSGLQN